MGKKANGAAQRPRAFYEILIAVVIVVLILIPQMVGTTTVADPSKGLTEDGYPATTKTLKDLEAAGTRFGTITNKEWEAEIQKRFPQGEIRHYNSFSDSYTSLESGEVDAAMGFIDEQKSVAETHPGVAYIEQPFASVDFGFGVQKSARGDALCDELNKFLFELKSSGEYNKLKAKWEDKNRKSDAMGNYSFSGEKGQLKIATNGLWTPMTYFEGEKLTGLFIEILNRFCESRGYAPEYETVAKSAEMTGLASGTYDIVADSVTASPERLETINVTDPLMKDDYYIVVKRDPVLVEVPKAEQFWKDLQASFNRTFIAEGRYKILFSGLGVTIALSLIAGVFGTILGILICFLRTRKQPLLSAFASLYIRIFRALPVVVLLLVLNYLVLKDCGLEAFWVCAITFSIEFSAYCAEIFRSGINAVPEGQSKAAAALGFSRTKAFRKVVLPQALVHMLPTYSGQFIATVKMTAVAGYISVIDLTKASDIIRSRTYEAFFPLILTSIVYFVLCAALIALLRILERRCDPTRRRIKPQVVQIVETYQPKHAKSVESSRAKGGQGRGQTLLEIEHLKKSFGEVTPLADVCCEVYEGDVVSIIGPSGTGKSTLLNLVNHLEVPDGGSIVFEGQDTLAEGYDYNRLRESIGMVFQSFNLFSHLTIVENLMLAQTELLKRDCAAACNRSMELLHMVGLADKALSLPAQLSGGQQQRAAIVRAMAMDPKILLFDEPTSALDPTMVGEVLTVIRNLARDGMTMLVVTHEMRFAKDVSTRVFFMDEGVIYEEGSPNEVFGNPQRDKTRRFINHLKVLDTTMRRADFDAMDMVTRIERFGYRHMISGKLVNRMLTIAEDLCVQTILPRMDPYEELHLSFEYDDSDGGRVTVEVTYPEGGENPLEEADEFVLALVRHACPDLSWTCVDGLSTVRGHL
ncbi:MAG: ABC transporter permease subunit [Atopobiaceae bacterium]|nr:ABC transporter permease subunit [Atopobiaceae bacterium]